MIGLFKKKKGRLIGLDIGSSAVRMLLLNGGEKGAYSIDAYGLVPLPPEAIVEGAIIDPNAVIDAIQHLMNQVNVKQGKVAFSIGGSSVFVKKVTIAGTEDPLELRESVYWEAEQFLPFPREEVMLDYHLLGDPTVQPKVDVVVVALKRDIAQVYIDTIQQTGLEPAVLDIDAFAVQNAFELNYQAEYNSSNVFMLLNIGASKTTINVIQNGEPLLVRDAMIGMRILTELIKNEFNLTYDQAELVKRGRHEIRLEQVRPYVSQVSQDIAREIDKTMRFFTNSYPELKVSKVFLCGGGALTPGLVDYIKTVVKVPAELCDPMRLIDTSHVDEEFIEEVRYASAVVVGLALRRP